MCAPIITKLYQGAGPGGMPGGMPSGASASGSEPRTGPTIDEVD